MNAGRPVLLLVLACAASLGVAALAQAQTKSPTQAYLDYRAAVAKATALSEVLPHLSKAYRAMLEGRPKADHPAWLRNLQEAEMKDVKVTGETIKGDTCWLQATGISPRGNPMKGKITMVREGGVWKLDEASWGTSG